MASDEGPGNLTEDAQPRIGQWKNFQNPHPELPNPHLSQKPQVSLTREELRVLQECNRESFWYRSMPACLFCIGATQFAVTKGYLKPHPKYGAGLKTLGAALLGYILGKISYQNECRQKIMALPNSQLAETLRQRLSKRRLPSEFVAETPTGGAVGSHDISLPSTDNNAPDILYNKPDQIASDTAKFEDSSAGNSGEQDPLYKSYGDLRRQNREIYQENQVVKWQNIPNRPKNQQPITSETPEDNTSQWVPLHSSTKQRGPKNQYGDVWEE